MNDAPNYGVTRVQVPPRAPVVACLIIGIDGWDQYTRPLAEAIRLHEPHASIVVIDNASTTPYPQLGQWAGVVRTERLCYSAAINRAKQITDEVWGLPDWYIVLSNDVACSGKFGHLLATIRPGCIAGPHMAVNGRWRYLEGWCVAIPRGVWVTLGGWDEQYQVSSWEDVDLSATAVEKGFGLAHVPNLPFTHLDQRQRFNLIPDYWDSERHNIDYFIRKRERALTEGA